MKTMIRQLWNTIGAALITALLSSPAMATNIDLYRPNAGPTGTARLLGSQGLGPRHLTIGLAASYADNPLVLDGFLAAPTTRAVVNQIFTHHLFGEIGIHERIGFGFDLPASIVQHIPATGGFTERTTYRIGDVAIYSKIGLLLPERDPMGLAIVPFVEAPTGQVGNFSGEQNADFGAKLVLDKQWNDFWLGANVGYRGRASGETITVIGSTSQIVLDDELTYGIGGVYEALPDRLQVMADVTGSTVLKDFAKQENSSPLEATGAVRALFRDRALALTVGGGAGILEGYGAPRFRVFANLSHTWSWEGERKAKAPTTTDRKEIKTIVLMGVHFDTARASLRPDGVAILNNNLEWLQTHAHTTLVIEGHTDSRGSVAYNQRLSERRAASVRDFYLQQGLTPERLDIAPQGELQPIAPNTTPDTMAINRRVVVRIYE